MSIDTTTAAQLARFKAVVPPATTSLSSAPTASDLETMQALEQGYLRLVQSIVESNGDAGWTGWNWRENDEV